MIFRDYPKLFLAKFVTKITNIENRITNQRAKKGVGVMNREKNKREINKAAFWPAIIALTAFVVYGAVNSQALGAIMSKVLEVIADYFGAYINILSLIFLILAAVIIISKYGDVVIGGKDAKPDYSMPTWCAMSICSGIGTGLLFWAIGEPIYHYMQTPTAIGEPETRTSAIFAVAQSMWDWSFIQYAMYAVCGAAFAVLCFNKGKSLSLSSVVESVTNKKISWLNTLITSLVIFCLMGATANSMGVGLMQIGAGLEAVFGIAQTPIVWIIIAVFVATMFILSCVSGIGKGLKLVSTICMYFFIFLMVYVYVFGNTQFIGKISSEAIGFIIDHWGTQTMLMNAMAPDDKWFSEWSVMYWNSFIMYAPIIGMFLARMGKGRKVRTFMLVQVLVPSIFCIIWIGIFGGQTIFLQTSGTLDVWGAVQSSGMQATVFKILESLPGSRVIIVMFLITIILSFCTLADPMASVASTLSVNGLSANVEPPKKQKILVGIILAAVACTLVISGGTTAIKGMINLNGLIQSVVMILCAISFFESCKKCPKTENEEDEQENQTAELPETAEKSYRGRTSSGFGNRLEVFLAAKSDRHYK